MKFYNDLNLVKTDTNSYKITSARKTSTFQKSYARILNKNSLNDMTLLDIGCGSGLYPVVTLEEGAYKVLGIFYIPGSVAAIHNIQQQVATHALRRIRG